MTPMRGGDSAFLFFGVAFLAAVLFWMPAAVYPNIPVLSGYEWRLGFFAATIVFAVLGIASVGRR